MNGYERPASLPRFRFSATVLATIMLAASATFAQSTVQLSIFTQADRTADGRTLELMSMDRTVALDVDVDRVMKLAPTSMILEDVPVAPGLVYDLELESWNIVENDAHLVYAGADGESPISVQARLYRGTIVGQPESDVYMSFSDGSLLGRVSTVDKTYELSTDHSVKFEGGSLPVLAYPSDAVTNYAGRCGVTQENLDELRGGAADDHGYSAHEKGNGSHPSAAQDVDYAVPGAWEGDVEYVGLFGGEQAAADYMVQLIGHVSSVYERDLSAQLTIAHMKLWTSTSADGYPYTENQIMSVALRQVRTYWNIEENKQIDKAFAHTFSGKPWVNPIGIAWLDVLCPETRPNLAARVGAFSAITRTNTARDRHVVAHETGHNFGANHTHHCGWGGEYGGAIHKCAPAEGGDCFGTTQQMVGTIMSYCNQREDRFHPLVIDRLKDIIATKECLIPSKKLEIQPQLIVFGNEVQGVARDTTFDAFFSNIGSTESITVSEVMRSGKNNDQFEILDGDPPFTLEPGESRIMKVRFKAEIDQEARMSLVYQHDGLNPPVNVTFEGYASDIRPRLGLRNDAGEIDFGERYTGSRTDTALDGFFINLGVDGSEPDQRATLYITDTWIGGPDKLDFQLIRGTAPLQIEGLDRVDAAFEFTPTSVGAKEAWLYVESNSEGVPGTLDSFRLKGTGKVGPAMQLAIRDLIIDFGDVPKLQLVDTLFSDFFKNVGGETMLYFADIQVIEGEDGTFNSNNVGVGELQPGDSDPMEISFYAGNDATLGLKRGKLIVIGSDENLDFDVSQDTIFLVGNATVPLSVDEDMTPNEHYWLSPNSIAGSDVTAVMVPRAGEEGDLYLISILDVEGREVFRTIGRFGGSGESRLAINTESLASGVYYVRLSTNRGIRTRKLTISR